MQTINIMVTIFAIVLYAASICGAVLVNNNINSTGANIAVFSPDLDEVNSTPASSIISAEDVRNELPHMEDSIRVENLPNGATIGRISLPDGRAATILAYSGILAKDTRLPSYMDITLRQITDGKKVAQAVLGHFGNIMDCDVSFDQSDISRFSDDFMTSQLKVEPERLSFVPHSEFNDKMRQLVNLNELVQNCHSYQRSMYGLNLRKQRKPRRNDHHLQRTKRSLVWPGTKWCGKGDDASKYTSLGSNGNTDRCCRLHDHCPYTIEGFSTKYGTFNYRFHTVSHCDCDYSFRTCLRSANSGTANMIGVIYFNVVRLPCFIFVPEQTCTKRTWWGKCEAHSVQYVAEVQQALSFDSQV